MVAFKVLSSVKSIVEYDWTIDNIEVILSMGKAICGEMFILRNNSFKKIFAAKIISFDQIKKLNFFNYLV